MNQQNKLKKEQLVKTAFPAQAAMDNYNQIFTPFPGMTRFEHYVLTIYTSDINIDEDDAIVCATDLITKIDNYLKNFEHEEAQIIL
jgi:hypothetical protein